MNSAAAAPVIARLPFNRCDACANAFSRPDWNFCYSCGLPTRMPCPECAGGIESYIGLRSEDDFAPTQECPNGHLLKSCPACGKLHSMGSHFCDQRDCSGAALIVPLSSWPDAHGGVTRRRIIRMGRRSTAPPNAEPVTVAPHAGDNVLCAYGHVYIDRDPYVMRISGEAGTGSTGFRQRLSSYLRPIPTATALLAHSGYLAVLGCDSGTASFGGDGSGDEDAGVPAADTATLLDSMELHTVNAIDAPGTDSQILADGVWWLFGSGGVAVYSLSAVQSGVDTTAGAWNDEDVSGALPPVRLGKRRVWLALPDGRWFVFRAVPGADSRHLAETESVRIEANGRLEPGMSVIGAFLGGPVTAPKWAALLAKSNSPDAGGDAHSEIFVWSLDALSSEDPPQRRSLSFTVLPTWATDSLRFYLAEEAGNRIVPFRFDLLNQDQSPISFPGAVAIRSLTTIEEPASVRSDETRLLCETESGQFQVVYTQSGRREVFSSVWVPQGRVKSWAPWGSSSIVAVVQEEEAVVIRLIAADAAPDSL